MNIRKKFRQDTGYNLLQTGFLQATGLVTFFFTSRFLEKADYGLLNWALALSTMVTALCGLGLDQIITHRIAATFMPAKRKRLFGIHFFHTLFAGSVLALGGAVAALLGKGLPPYFLLVYFSTLFLYFASSFKVSFAGSAAFKPLAHIAIAGGSVKMLGIPALWAAGCLNSQSVAIVWLLSGMVEMSAALFAGSRSSSTGTTPHFNKQRYGALLKAASPLFLALLFDTFLSRVDWVLLGVLSTQTETANYAFAYKIFELSKLPLMVAGPLFLPYLTKALHPSVNRTQEDTKPLSLLLTYLMAVSVLLPLAAALVWTPVMGTLSKGKYGESNLLVYLLLSLCVPLHYLTNFYYFKATALNKYRSILGITAFVSLLNIGLNALFIPRWGGAGAAGAFLLATAVQTLLYLLFVKAAQIRLQVLPLLTPIAGGVLSYWLALQMPTTILKAVAGLGAYALFAGATVALARRHVPQNTAS